MSAVRPTRGFRARSCFIEGKFMIPRRKLPLSRRALLPGVFALFMAATASPVLASCDGVAGSDVCVEPKQYEPRYTINAEGFSYCPTYEGPPIQAQ